jgi:hypothetical protein
MKRIIITVIFALLLGLSSNAQNITYDGLISINWNDHPFSIVEMLMEKGFNYMGKLSIGDPLDSSVQTRESLYNLIYGYKNLQNPNVVVNVVVDEMCNNNISSNWPVVKLRFTYKSKNIFNKLSNDIKTACGESFFGFYTAPNSLTFAIDKELFGGEPSYIILIYLLSKEMLEENINAAKEMLEQLLDE